MHAERHVLLLTALLELEWEAMRMSCFLDSSLLYFSHMSRIFLRLNAKKDVSRVQLGIVQEQKPILSQQQIQALHILEMNAFELHAFLSKQALENPFIQYEGALFLAGHVPQNGDMEGEDNGDAYLNIRSAAHNRVTIHEHLAEQAKLANLSPDMRGHVLFLIDRLDKNGYLAMRSAEIATALSVSADTAKAALRCLQSFSPAGVSARSLRECLLLQIKRSPSPDPLAFRIVHDHLDLLAKRRIRKLAELCGVSEADILRAQETVVSLNPKPGNGFASTSDTPYAPPDLLVEQDEEGQFTVLLNPAVCSKFQVDIDGARRIRKNNMQDSENTTYINERLESARCIGASLHRRDSTLLSCGEAIVTMQQAFFLGDSPYPCPHTMQELAAVMSRHASTVTRTLKNKTLRCDIGVFPLSFFFTRFSYPSNGGDKTIAYIRGRIASLIRVENHAAPLSDQQLAQLLAGEGIAISRRTVAKHREALGIACSHARTIIQR
ncbi:MAG: RNA polymerase factor sigma-54 [Bacillota bacterium]